MLPDAEPELAEHHHQARGHQQHRDGEDADVDASSCRGSSSEVVPFCVRAVEQELQRRRCVELQLGVRLVRDVGVVGDQERRPVPGSAVLLAGNVRQAAAVRSARGVHDRQALGEGVVRSAGMKLDAVNRPGRIPPMTGANAVERLRRTLRKQPISGE